MAMSLQKVIEETVSEALADYSRAIDEALSETLDRLRQLRSQITLQASQELERVKREAEAHRLRLSSQAELEAKRLYLTVIDEAVKKVLDAAVDKLRRERGGKRYHEAMRRLLLEALDAVGGEVFKVWSSEEDLKLVNEIAKEAASERNAKITVVKQPIKCIGGVKVSNGDESVIFDNTIDARLEKLSQAIRSEIVSLLTS